ncbi:hypothetical protein Dimus_015074 [Dionaea muscipula]
MCCRFSPPPTISCSVREGDCVKMEVEEVERNGSSNEKGKLDIDFNQLLREDDDEPPPQLVIVGNTSDAAAAAATSDSTSSPTYAMGSGNDRPLKQRRGQGEEQTHSGPENLAEMSDHQLDDAIHRTSRLGMLSATLPDRGAKLRNHLERLNEERERRKLRRLHQDSNECKKPVQSEGISPKRASDETIEVDPSSQGPMQSHFASRFVQKLEESDSCKGAPFDIVLGRCDQRKRNRMGRLSKKGKEENGFSPKGREKMGFLSRKTSFQPLNFYSANANSISRNGHQTVRASLRDTSHSPKEKPCSSPKRSDGYQALCPDASRNKKGKTVVLDDEEDLQSQETSKAAEEVTPSFSGATIYYPSREDPQSIEIHYSDLQCLAPEAYLTSPIMNFYIRFLQGPSSPTDTARCAYHFFNTYFYKKLQDAVSYQKSDKEAFFIKFRRWWKGVNIFQKAYVLLPIHESLHWSLVIICIPDKEDDSGPIILHLDSLRYHTSDLIFNNIKSFLRDEWNFVNNDVGPVDIPIADRIWKYLPRRIVYEKITVPQQENDYDCGLFVLYFMERFIEEAPQRLKKRDLAMFGRRWFKPEEASGLRGKIKSILVSEFCKSGGEKPIWEPVCSSSESDRARSSSEHISIS